MSEFEKPPVGGAISKVPEDVIKDGVQKLSHDVNGNIRQDQNGKPFKIIVVSARENGSYKGRVIANGDRYLVQAIGKDEKAAIVHEKANLTFQSNTLKWRDEHKRLGQASIQIHYTGEKADVYPYNPDRNREARKEKEATPIKEPIAKEPISKEKFNLAAQEFAKTIEDPKKRDAFLKAIEKHTAEPKKETPAKATAKAPAKAPAKGKAQEVAKEKAVELGDGGR
jgi:hypothetical protein